MRIAILVSGSMRTFDAAWPINESILRSLGNKYDIYFHSWKQNIGTYHGVAKGVSPKSFFWRWYPTKFREPSLYDPAAYMSKEFNPKVMLENFSNLSMEMPKLSEIYAEPDMQTYINSTAMYLGMERVAKMAIESGIPYSHFLRIRSDFVLNRKFEFSDFENVVMCSDGVSIEGKMISDQCFYAPFELISPLMFSFSFLKDIVEREGWICHNSGSKRKAEFVLFENIRTSCLTGQIIHVPRKRFGKILREVEVRDSTVRLSDHFRGILIHNRIVFLKLAIFYFAKVARKLHITNFLKYIFKEF